MIRSRLAAAAAGVLAAGTVLAIAAPAMALAPLPPDCTVAHTAATPPPQYTAPCTPTVTGTNPIASTGGMVTLTMPGVGAITINVDGSGNIMATPTPATGFKTGTLVVNNETGVVSVTFSNKDTVGPGVKPETYVIKAKVSQLPGTAGFAVQTVAKPVNKHHHHDDEGQGDDKQGDNDSQGAVGHGAGGDDGGGGGGD